MQAEFDASSETSWLKRKAFDKSKTIINSAVSDATQETEINYLKKSKCFSETATYE
jgi:hypothetical protein